MPGNGTLELRRREANPAPVGTGTFGMKCAGKPCPRQIDIFVVCTVRIEVRQRRSKRAGQPHVQGVVRVAEGSAAVDRFVRQRPVRRH